MENARKTRKDGMPVGTPFTSERQPEGRGRPAGSISLDTRIRMLLEDTEKLPDPIKNAIRAQCGSDAKAMDAMIVVGLLQALQGDNKWAQLIWDRGWGKVPDHTILSGDADNPLVVTSLAELIASQDGITKTVK